MVESIPIPFDLATLRIIWWALLGVLLAGFAITDGFDLGIAMLLPVIGKNDRERQLMLHAIEPVWEGNQVWLVLGAGSIFAAWPYVYAASFAGFYFAIFVGLFALMVRPVGFKLRNKIVNADRRLICDYFLSLCGMLPALVFGITIGNVLLGVPFHFDEYLRFTYLGTFAALFSSFSLLCGVLAVLMFIAQGAMFLHIKTSGALQARARMTGKYAVIGALILFAIGGLYTAYFIDGYAIQSLVDKNATSNPLYKTVVAELGLWHLNFSNHYSWLLIPSSAVLSGIIAIYCFSNISSKDNSNLGIIATSVMLASMIATVGVSMYPFLLPCSNMPNFSLTIWDASSSRLTLFIMLIAIVVFLPIVLAYTAWVYRVLRGKVNNQDLEDNQGVY